MSDAEENQTNDDLAAVRARKREELREKLERHGSLDAAVAAEEDGDDDAEGAPEEPVHVEGAADLDELVAESPVVFVDFYADWCGPCKMVEPHVEALAAETDAAVAKVDVDRNQELAARYGARSIPTFVVFADGEQVERLQGAQSRSTLFSTVQRYL
ncbi:MAG: thioredoxin [Halolamina sp.]